MQSRYTLHHAYNSSAMNMRPVNVAGDCSICRLQIIPRFEGDILKASGIGEIGGAK
jgi:hypothetical protein